LCLRGAPCISTSLERNHSLIVMVGEGVLLGAGPLSLRATPASLRARIPSYDAIIGNGFVLCASFLFLMAARSFSHPSIDSTALSLRGVYSTSGSIISIAVGLAFFDRLLTSYGFIISTSSGVHS